MLSPSTTTPFQKAQQALENKITARQVQLVLLGTELADAANVTSSDRSTLSGIIDKQNSALATDYHQRPGRHHRGRLDGVRQAMIGDERVYAVVTAQVDVVMGADNDTVVEAGYTDLVSEFGPLVGEFSARPTPRLASSVSAEVGLATTATTGISAGALALTPAGYPANQGQITTYTTELAQAAHDLSAAKGDVKRIEAIALGDHIAHVLKPV